MRNIEIVAEKTNTGFSGYAKKYAVATTGETFHELKKNLVEALNLYFEESGREVREQDLRIRLDIAQFFTFYKVLNAKAFSKYVGMNQSLLAQYTHGIKTPSARQTERIINGIRKLGKELSEIEIEMT
ncbi:MAG: XRE family transcriptional regulator [Bacteroidales bacterium]|nr:XRE family transcriptional regulator [Bacteroidales bacterium]